jgi:S-adenosylmethionine-dependent methyltransferase
VGAGTGRLALRLAEAGHQVCLLDPSRRMLAFAQKRAAHLPVAVRRRLSYRQAGLETLADEANRSHYDLVLLHCVLEYLPSPETALLVVAGALAPGGLLSIVFANRLAEPLRRAVIERKSERVRAALTEDAFAEQLFGLERRLLTAVEVRRQLDALGLEVEMERGIRAFADYLDFDGGDGDLLAEILDLELQVGAVSPYKDIAHYVQIICRRAGSPALRRAGVDCAGGYQAIDGKE